MICKVCQYILTIISPWKRAWPLIEQTWFPITQGCFVPSFVEIGPVVLKKKIFEVRRCIFAISLLSPLGNGRGPSYEHTWIPITQECFVLSLVKIGPVILENTIFKVCQCIFPISFLSPLGKVRGPSIEQTWIPITQRCFVPSFVEIGPVVLKAEDYS